MAIQPAKSRISKNSEWVSKSEAARLRGVSRQAIWELVKRGRLSTFVLNGRTYLKRADVLRFRHDRRGPYARVPAAEVISRFNAEKYNPAHWLSLSEAASALNITHPAMADLIRKRRFKTIVIADKILVSRPGVQKFKSRQGSAKAKSKRAKS